ncbi:MAG: DUF2935 domain-containing protein [bacterium]
MTDNINWQGLSLRQEIDFWLGIMVDHSRFMRNGFDPTEEEPFRIADDFALRFAFFKQQNEMLPDLSPDFLFSLQELVGQLIDFKARIAAGIESCRILSILSAGLIDHIRREALFFFGILARIKGEPRPTREQLGLPMPGIASTAPQAFIPRLPQEFEEIAYEELLFWLRIAFEHMGVLAQGFRPEQKAYRRETLRWQQRLERLHDAVLQGFEAGTNPARFIEPTLALIQEHAEFLAHLFNDLAHCTIPGQQANFWPRLVDHMRREDIYFIQVLTVLKQALTCPKQES